MTNVKTKDNAEAIENTIALIEMKLISCTPIEVNDKIITVYEAHQMLRDLRSEYKNIFVK